MKRQILTIFHLLPQSEYIDTMNDQVGSSIHPRAMAFLHQSWANLLTLPSLLMLLYMQPSLAQYPNYEIDGALASTSIPFEMHNGFMVLNVKLDNRIPLKFILDSGSAYTILIYQEFTDLLGIGYEREIRIQGVDRNMMITALVSAPLDLKLEHLTAHDQRILVLRDSRMEFGKYAGVHIAGILGMDLFRRFVVRLDYETQQIHLYEPKEFSAVPKGYTSLNFEVQEGKMYLLLPIELEADRMHEVLWLVDTGAALSLMLHCPESDSTLLPKHGVPGNIGRGLGGFVMGYKGRVHRFEIGDHDLRGFSSNFQVLPDSVHPPQQPLVGLIGNDIWRQFDVLFQFHEQKVHIRPNKHFHTSFSKDLSGISIIAAGPQLNQYFVEEVYPNSPAEKTGVLPGDQIVKINRGRSGFMSLDKVQRKLNPKIGKILKITIRRGGERVKLRMKLTPYY